MVTEKKVIIKIYGGENAIGSCSGCGVGSVGAGLENAVKENSERFKEEFGSTVEFAYIDTAKEGRNKYPELIRFIDAGYSFPITVVNGEARLSGDISYKDLRTIIQVTLENYHNLG